MNHHASPDFWACYQGLPPEAQRLADKAYDLLKRDPRHPSLRLKKVSRYWSVRVGRAVAGVAHTLQGALCNFAAPAALATAARLEGMGEHGDLGAARETLGALADEVARLSRELAARLEG